ncbi:unnamed protein product, partial [Cyprideis torosa]
FIIPSLILSDVSEDETSVQNAISCPTTGLSHQLIFSAEDYHLGDPNYNTTFRVYLYDLQPPLIVTVAFSQHPKLDLLQFFITFSTCFLSLLVIAAILWKIKVKYDIYQRRQRVLVEMEAMASRPFSQVLLFWPKKASDDTVGLLHPNGPSLSLPGGEILKDKASADSTKNSASPIALEPCANGKAAVLSLLVRLPTGDESYAPRNTAGVCVGSALVSLGSPRKSASGDYHSLKDPPKDLLGGSDGSCGAGGGGGTLRGGCTGHQGGRRRKQPPHHSHIAVAQQVSPSGGGARIMV